MIYVAITLNRVKVVMQKLQEKHSCGKLKILSRVTSLIILELSEYIS